MGRFLDSAPIDTMRGIGLGFVLFLILFGCAASCQAVKDFVQYETGFLHAPECLPCEYPSSRIIQDQIDAGIRNIDCAGKTYFQDGVLSLSTDTHLSNVRLETK